MRPRWIALLVAGAALAFAAVVLAATRAHHEANDLRGSASGPASHFNGALLPAGLRVPNFNLKDQDGR